MTRIVSSNSSPWYREIFTNGNFLYKSGNLYFIFRLLRGDKKFFLTLLVLNCLQLKIILIPKQHILGGHSGPLRCIRGCLAATHQMPVATPQVVTTNNVCRNFLMAFKGYQYWGEINIDKFENWSSPGLIKIWKCFVYDLIQIRALNKC